MLPWHEKLLNLLSFSICHPFPDPHLGWLSARQWVVLGACVLITTAMEAYTWQIDNLTLPLLQYALVISFLG